MAATSRQWNNAVGAKVLAVANCKGGTGKSTVATEAAYRLGITRVTSTDFVRQTMRAFFSRDFMPSIHYSSFEAGDALHEPEGDPALQGFQEQTRNVLVGVHAALERALEEGWSMVLEGLHLVPGLIPVQPIGLTNNNQVKAGYSILYNKRNKFNKQKKSKNNGFCLCAHAPTSVYQ